VIHVHLLDAANHLGDYRQRILEVSKQTLAKVQELLSVDQIDVMIVRNPTWTIPESGFGGYCPEPHLVQIWLDPKAQNFEANLELELAATLAHELHHAKRWQNPGYGKTLLEAMVTEGLAQCFETDFRNGQTPFYAVPFEKAEMTELLARARLEFENSNYNHAAWFFGDETQNLLRWTGYKLGFEIVNHYLEQTNQTAAQACAVEAKTVLETLGG
jgi:uncharacterized protein YjaZ